MVIGGRIVKGLAVGIFSSILPVYISEVLPPNRKGLGTSIMQWSLTWGIMLMYYTTFLCNFLGDERAFRTAWGIEMSPGFFLLIFSLLLPESPKWLASRSKWEKASLIMNKLNKCSSAKDEPREMQVTVSGDEKLNSIVTVIDKYDLSSRNCSYIDLFRKNLRKHLVLGVTTQLLTQLSGISVLMYYLIFICQMVGLSGNVRILSASVQYIVNVLFTIFPMLWLDKMRRKDVLVFGASALGVCITAIGCVMGYYGHAVSPMNGNESVVWEITGTPGSLCLALCFLFVALFASTLSCAGWLYTNEILPQKAKAKGSAICMSVSWALNFTLTFLAPFSLKYIRWATFLLFGVFCVSGALIIGFLFPETYGLSETQVEELYKPKIEVDQGSKEAQGDLVAGDVNQLVGNPDNDPDSTEREAGYTIVHGSDNSKSSSKNPTASERRYKSSIPSRVNELHHNIIQETQSMESTQTPENVSPFLKKMGGPFQTDSELSALQVNVEGNEQISATYSDGLIGHYYHQGTNESPFLNQYNNSPFK